MRIGTMLGGEGWAELKKTVKEQERAAKRARKEELQRKKRRAELDEMGFKPLGGRK